MTLKECKAEREKKNSELFAQCRLFWAFSNEQFAENKTPLQDGEKYVSIGMGGYLPDSQVSKFRTGLNEIGEWYAKAVSDNGLRRKEIVYELTNHEAWYTGDIEDTLAALGPDYTAEEVYAVFNEEAANQEF